MAAEHDHDPEIAAELRREWSEEAAEDERLTELLRMRRRTMAEVVEDIAHRRAGVRVTAGGHSFNGAVVWTGEDFATVRAPGQDVDIRLEAGIWEEVQAAGTDPDIGRVESFAAHLHELAASGGWIGVLLAGADTLTGRIEVVAGDHVVVADRDDRTVFVPRGVLLGTIRPSDSH